MEKDQKSLISSSKREDGSEERPTKPEDELGQTPSDESGRGTGSTEKSSLSTPQASGSASGTDAKGETTPSEDSTAAKSPGKSPTKAKSPKKESQQSPKPKSPEDNPTLRSMLGNTSTLQQSPIPEPPKNDNRLLKEMLAKSTSPSEQQNGTAKERALVHPPPGGMEGSDSSSAPMTPDTLSPSDEDLDSVESFVGASATADATVPPPATRRVSEVEREVTSQISTSLDLGGVAKSDRGSEEASGASPARRAKRHQVDSEEAKEVPDPEPSPKKQPKHDTDKSKSDPKEE